MTDLQISRVLGKLGNMFVCPKCKEKLSPYKNNLNCNHCNQIYKKQAGIYDFVLPTIERFKKKEADFHSAIVDSYYDTAQLDALRNKYAHEDFLKVLYALKKGAKVLELGCGLGQDGRAVMKQGIFVVQTDISPKTLAVAKQKAQDEGLTNSEFVRVDSENLPFPDDYFDATFMVASLHHMMNPNTAIAEMKRCTKKEGHIIIGMEPNKWQFYLLFPFIRCYKKYIKKMQNCSPGDELTYGFSKKDLKKLAKQNNLLMKHLSPIWYCNGFVHIAMQVLSRILKRKIDVPHIIAKICIGIDALITHIYLIKNYPWHWNLILQKQEAS